MNLLNVKSHDKKRVISVALLLLMLCSLCAPEVANAEIASDTITLVAKYCVGVDDAGIVRVLADSGFQTIDVVPASLMNCRIIRGTLLNVGTGTDTFYRSIVEMCRMLKMQNIAQFAHPLYSLEECKESLLDNSPNYIQRQISLLFYGELAKDSLENVIESGQLSERQAFEAVINYALLCGEGDSGVVVKFLQDNSDNFLNRITGINAIGLVRGTSQFSMLKDGFDSETDDGLKQVYLFALGNTRHPSNNTMLKSIVDSEAVTMQLRLSAGIILAKREETAPLYLARNVVDNPGNYSLDNLQYAINIIGMIGNNSDSVAVSTIEAGRNVELIRTKRNAGYLIHLRSLDNENKRELYEDVLRTGSIDDKDNVVICWIVKDISNNKNQQTSELLEQAIIDNEYWVSTIVDDSESAGWYSHKSIMLLLGAAREKENRDE